MHNVMPTVDLAGGVTANECGTGEDHRHSASAAEIARAAQPCPLDTSFRRTSGGHARESGPRGRIRVSDRDTCLRRTAKRTSHVPRVIGRSVFDFAIETCSRDGIQ
jgi:hypothetical protein